MLHRIQMSPVVCTTPSYLGPPSFPQALIHRGLTDQTYLVAAFLLLVSVIFTTQEKTCFCLQHLKMLKKGFTEIYIYMQISVLETVANDEKIKIYFKLTTF